MNAKTILTAIFAAILLIGTVSAISIAQVGTTSIPSNVSFTSTSFTIAFTLNNTDQVNGGTVNFGSSSVTSPSGATISVTPANPSFNANQTQAFTATVSYPAGTGNVAGTIVADASAGSDITIPFSVPRVAAINFCRAGEKGGNLTISDISIDTDGEDEETWRPLDIVTVEVEVSNEGDDDVDDIIVELGIFDSSGKNQVGDFDFTNADEEEIELGDLSDGDEETVVFEFRVPADIDDGNYEIKVKAYSEDLGESVECVDTSSDFDQTTHQEIEVEAEDDEGKFIAFDNVEFNPTEATCGDQVTLSFDAYNIGEDDEDRIRINAVSSDLRFDLSQEITSGLDQGDHEEMLFTFTVPQNLADKTYRVELSAEYQYDDGVYEEESDEAEVYSLRVFGCSIGSGSGSGSGSNARAAISASLDSEAQAGEELTVTATITNRLSTEASYVIDASGYESWAKLDSISDRIITLAAGESEEVTFVFTVDKDAAGEQTFTIEAQNGETVSERDVVVELAEAKGFSLGNNGLFWTIAIVNVVLLIAIILVAIRLSRN